MARNQKAKGCKVEPCFKCPAGIKENQGTQGTWSPVEGRGWQGERESFAELHGTLQRR